MGKRLIILAAAAFMVGAFAIPASAGSVATYEVTITNLAASQPISPPVVVTHARDVSFFRVGSSASGGIVAIAENGDPGVAVGELTGAAGVTSVVNVGQPLTLAGTTFGDFSDSVTVEVNAVRGDVISLAGMLICTNDGFAGINSAALPRRGSATFYAKAYDAGSEHNTELSADIVDACSLLGPVELAGDDNGNNNDGIDTFRRILPHRGINGVGDLSLDHNWSEPVLAVTVTRTG